MQELNIEVRPTPGEIACNFDEIEVALKEQMTAYAELEVTEDNIPERKADVATLRKIKTAIDDKRKEIKKTFTQPLTDFEGRVKKLTGIIDEQIDHINDGLNAFELKRVTEKRAHVKELYDKEIGDLAEYLPYDVIKSSKWDNKTCSDTEIISDLQEMILRVKSDLETISGLQSEIEDKLIATYKANGNNLTAAIRKNTDYQDAKRAAEKRVEEERRAEEVRKAAEAARAEVMEKAESIPEPIPEPEAVPFEVEPTLTIKVRGAENIEALRTFLDMSEIEFEEV